MKILDTLHDTRQGAIPFIWKATLIALIPSLCIGFILSSLLPEITPPDFSGPPLINAVGVLIVSPVIETLLLWLGIVIIQLFEHSTIRIALVSAAIWAMLHSLAVPIWGLAAAWPFYVFSVSFIEWRKISRWKALSIIATIHMLHNTVPAIYILMDA